MPGENTPTQDKENALKGVDGGLFRLALVLLLLVGVLVKALDVVRNVLNARLEALHLGRYVRRGILPRPELLEGLQGQR